jgi:3-oxoacyl-[acyl-carrier protein] reductase
MSAPHGGFMPDAGVTALLMKNFRPIGGRMGRPGDVADAAEYFASDIAGWVSGQRLFISGGAQQ